MSRIDADVVIVGAGNAALVAALAAHDVGVHVVVLEAAPEEERGGNSRFSGGIFRAVHQGLETIKPLLHESNDKVLDRVTVAPYTRQRYLDEWMMASEGRPPRELVETVVENSFDTLRWMHDHGVEWELTANKLFDLDKLDRTYELPPGGAIRARGEGVGLIERLFARVESVKNIEVMYDSPASSLIMRGSTVQGVRVRRPDGDDEVYGAVVLACGGFEANPEMRLRYLGQGWDLVKVRGTRFNMGTMLNQALQAGAQPVGHWGGCHASPQDATHPPVGDLRITDKLSRYSFPYSIMVNRNGERFVDEGENEVWLIYAKTGAAILAQPQATAYQIFDQRTTHLLEPRYSTGTPVQAANLGELAVALNIPYDRLVSTVSEFNAAVDDTAPSRFDPLKPDNVVAAPSGQPKKSNWAQRIDQPPYIAYPVTCGITFTYGGVKVDTEGRVIDAQGQPIVNLYATGEIAGDFFYHNYAAGSGLVRGAVFGRISGRNAAQQARAAAADEVAS